ncbi:MAG: tetratricopeptide repeat protein [Dechloromonas sp.]|nr:MAG: tetratricopeptide repeat protein [Dechloromonas sp.]
MIPIDDDDKLDFGKLPPEVDTLLQQGVAAHFSDRALAERNFLAALSLAPDALQAHRCLVKHYNRCRQFDKALPAAGNWVATAARQAGLPDNWLLWKTAPGSALAALKALAFVHLRSGQPAKAEAMIERVIAMDPEDAVGGSVVAALLEETRLAI